MKIEEKQFARLPSHLQELFVKQPNSGSEEVLAGFPVTAPSKATPRNNGEFKSQSKGQDKPHVAFGHSDNGGSAARFFYCAKASKSDRDEGMDGFDMKPSYMVENGSKTAGREGVRYDRTTTQRNNHPTVKPTALMRYLCRLVTPPGGTILEPFMGSGSTIKAAILEGFSAVGIERDAESVAIARARCEHAVATALAAKIEAEDSTRQAVLL